MKNRGLGRGLSALLKEEVLSTSTEMVKLIDIDAIEIGDLQPRKRFESDKIQELANSISNNGLLQPLIVTIANNPGKYRLVAGERRLRACKVANVLEIPVIIKHYDDDEILRVALLENIQREELSIIEEAEGYVQLIKKFKYTQEDISYKLGKSRSHIANLIRLTNLSPYIKEKLNEGLLTMGHARCLIGHTQGEIITDYIIENELNVRQTENIVKNWDKQEYSKLVNQNKTAKKSDSKSSSYDNDLKSLVETLTQKFEMKVTIENNLVGGKIVFHYKDPEELDKLLARLN